MQNWQNSYKTLKTHKLGEKKYPSWCIVVGQGNLALGPEKNLSETRQSLVSEELFWSSGGISLPTTIHMKDTLNPPHYPSRSWMYTRGLIPQNFTELAMAVQIDILNIVHTKMSQLRVVQFLLKCCILWPLVFCLFFSLLTCLVGQ